jgi:hypothetical protein
LPTGERGNAPPFMGQARIFDAAERRRGLEAEPVEMISFRQTFF